MDLNVLKDFPYRPRYYITHLWKWFRECWINLKNAWMRATKGYCYTDLWNMDDWFLEVLPRMLRQLAKDHQAYPGQPPFETPEKWERWLIEMAENLEYVASDPDEENEYSQAFMDAMDNCHKIRSETNSITYTYELDAAGEELKDKYFKREKELSDTRQEVLKDTMAELGQYLRNLWD